MISKKKKLTPVPTPHIYNHLIRLISAYHLSTTVYKKLIESFDI